jgi:hypothetical protein
MKASELSENVGKSVIANIKIDGSGTKLALQTVVVDARIVFGRVDYQLDYLGQTFWLSSEHIKI